MSKKKKGPSRQNLQQPKGAQQAVTQQPKGAQQAVTQQPKGAQQATKQQPSAQASAHVTIDDLKKSTSESEFDSIKDKLIERIIDEISGFEQEKNTAEVAAKDAQERLSKVESNLKELQISKDSIQSELDSAQKQLAAAQGAAQKAHQDADEKVKSKLDEAEKKRLLILAEASDKARNAWKKQADDLAAQIEGIAIREQTLQRERLKLESDKRDLDLQREDLADQKAFVKHQKEKYSAASPIKIEGLNQELNEMREKNECLQSKYGDQTKKFVELQTWFDSIKAEIGDSTNLEKSVTAYGLTLELKAIKAKYDSLVLLHERYPDDESIRPLEKAATEYKNLQVAYESIERERDRYRGEEKASQRTQKELEIIKQEVDATYALNEHLLKELESHKTALESRTGDTCPSLTKVDAETEDADFMADITDRKKRKSLATLFDIVSHVKNYAGSRKKEERLFYSDDDIRAFLAGMAVSRLIILQGMSGTGKSSLPRIFSEAISGFNRLIPVESSWRDRNELLGYYNDFNKKFNAKSFTIELYRSSKKPCVEIPTFIVLDEMNLARIEYYFSDFLAILQEPDSKKWLIELVSSDMRTLPMELPDEVKEKMRKDSPTIYSIWEKIEKSHKGELSSETTDDEKSQLSEYLDKLSKLTGAKDLIDGRKVRVTNNIWFIGTANRDESTFEISDKVYDRAQVISLNKKGIAEKKYEDREKMYISAANLTQMFENAITKNDVKAKVEAELEKLEYFLMEKFSVSFGNRIFDQTIDFAAVFLAAGGTLDNALDYQISTKILRKVIMTDDEEALSELQKLTERYPETQRLITKRMKEIK